MRLGAGDPASHRADVVCGDVAEAHLRGGDVDVVEPVRPCLGQEGEAFESCYDVGGRGFLGYGARQFLGGSGLGFVIEDEARGEHDRSDEQENGCQAAHALTVDDHYPLAFLPRPHASLFSTRPPCLLHIEHAFDMVAVFTRRWAPMGRDARREAFADGQESATPAHPAVRAAAAAVNALQAIAEIDLHDLDGQSVHNLIDRLESAARRVKGLQAEALAVAEAHGLWATSNAPSFSSWLAWRTQIAKPSANRVVKEA